MAIGMLFPALVMLFLFWNQVIEVAVEITSELPWQNQLEVTRNDLPEILNVKLLQMLDFSI